MRMTDKLAGEKCCTTCHETKPLEDFNLHTNGSQGRASKCKVCNSDYFRKRSLELRMPTNVPAFNKLIGWR